MAEAIRLSIYFDVQGQGHLQQGAMRLDQLADRLQHLAAQASGYSSAMRTMVAETNRAAQIMHDRLGAAFRVVNRGFEESFHFINRLIRFGFYKLTAEVLSAAYAVKKLFGEFVDINEQFAGLQITLESVFKSAQAARDIREELVKITVLSPVPFEDLAAASRSVAVVPQLSSQVAQQVAGGTLGDQDKFFRKYIRLVEQMLAFRPDKAVKDVTFSLREAATGELRSLIRRFDFPPGLLVSASGQSIGELRRDPVGMIEAIKKAMDRIITPQAVKELAFLPSNLYENIVEQVIKIPLLRTGDSGLYKAFTGFFSDMYNKIADFMQGGFTEAGALPNGNSFAQEISDSLQSLFFSTVEQTRGLAEDVLAVFNLSGEDRPDLSLLERMYLGVAQAAEMASEKLPEVISRASEFIAKITPALVKITDMVATALSWFAKMAQDSPLRLAGLYLGWRMLPTLFAQATSGLVSLVSGGIASARARYLAGTVTNAASAAGNAPGQGGVAPTPGAGLRWLNLPGARQYAQQTAQSYPQNPRAVWAQQAAAARMSSRGAGLSAYGQNTLAQQQFSIQQQNQQVIARNAAILRGMGTVTPHPTTPNMVYSMPNSYWLPRHRTVPPVPVNLGTGALPSRFPQHTQQYMLQQGYASAQTPFARGVTGLNQSTPGWQLPIPPHIQRQQAIAAARQSALASSLQQGYGPYTSRFAGATAAGVRAVGGSANLAGFVGAGAANVGAMVSTYVMPMLGIMLAGAAVGMIWNAFQKYARGRADEDNKEARKAAGLSDPAAVAAMERQGNIVGEYLASVKRETNGNFASIADALRTGISLPLGADYQESLTLNYRQQRFNTAQEFFAGKDLSNLSYPIATEADTKTAVQTQLDRQASFAGRFLGVPFQDQPSTGQATGDIEKLLNYYQALSVDITRANELLSGGEAFALETTGGEREINTEEQARAVLRQLSAIEKTIKPTVEAYSALTEAVLGITLPPNISAEDLNKVREWSGYREMLTAGKEGYENFVTTLTSEIDSLSEIRARLSAVKFPEARADIVTKSETQLRNLQEEYEPEAGLVSAFSQDAQRITTASDIRAEVLSPEFEKKTGQDLMKKVEQLRSQFTDTFGNALYGFNLPTEDALLSVITDDNRRKQLIRDIQGRMRDEVEPAMLAGIEEHSRAVFAYVAQLLPQAAGADTPQQAQRVVASINTFTTALFDEWELALRGLGTGALTEQVRESVRKFRGINEDALKALGLDEADINNVRSDLERERVLADIGVQRQQVAGQFSQFGQSFSVPPSGVLGDLQRVSQFEEITTLAENLPRITERYQSMLNAVQAAPFEAAEGKPPQEAALLPITSERDRLRQELQTRSDRLESQRQASQFDALFAGNLPDLTTVQGTADITKQLADAKAYVETMGDLGLVFPPVLNQLTELESLGLGAFDNQNRAMSILIEGLEDLESQLDQTAISYGLLSEAGDKNATVTQRTVLGVMTEYAKQLRSLRDQQVSDQSAQTEFVRRRTRGGFNTTLGGNFFPSGYGATGDEAVSGQLRQFDQFNETYGISPVQFDFDKLRRPVVTAIQEIERTRDLYELNRLQLEGLKEKFAGVKLDSTEGQRLAELIQVVTDNMRGYAENLENISITVQRNNTAATDALLGANFDTSSRASRELTGFNVRNSRQDLKLRGYSLDDSYYSGVASQRTDRTSGLVNIYKMNKEAAATLADQARAQRDAQPIGSAEFNTYQAQLESFLAAEAAAEDSLRRLQGVNNNAIDSLKDGFTSVADHWAATANNLSEIGSSAMQTMSSSFGQAWGTFISGANSAGEAMQQFGYNVSSALAQMAAQKSFETILGAVFKGLGSGGGFSFASGGIVSTTSSTVNGAMFDYGGELATGGMVPGNPSPKDSVLIYAAPGEFVIPTSVVRQWGRQHFEQYLNPIPAYSEGGYIPSPGGSSYSDYVPVASKADFSPQGGQSVTAPVNVTVNVDSQGNARSEISAEEQGRQLGKTIQAAVERIIVENQRQGGYFRRNR